MNAHIIARTFFLTTILVSASTVSLAETCYTVGGAVATENVTSTVQMGTISLTASNGEQEVFSKNGSLIGNITGTDAFGATLLSHKAKFSETEQFVSKGDKAELAPPYVLATLEDGTTACAFQIHETISQIVAGTGFFKNITNISVFADGSVSNCPNANKNEFVLSGSVCVE